MGRQQLREMKDISELVFYWLPIPNYFWIRNTVVHIVAVKVLCTPFTDEADGSVYRLVSPRVSCKSVSCSQVLYLTFGPPRELEKQMNKGTHMHRGTWLITHHRTRRAPRLFLFLSKVFFWLNFCQRHQKGLYFLNRNRGEQNTSIRIVWLWKDVSMVKVGLRWAPKQRTTRFFFLSLLWSFDICWDSSMQIALFGV